MHLKQRAYQFYSRELFFNSLSGFVSLLLILLLTGNALISLPQAGFIFNVFHYFCDLLVKGKLYVQTKWLIRLAPISSFCSMMGLGVFLFPSGWDVSSYIHQGGERHCDSEVSQCPRTQHNNVPDQDSSQDRLVQRRGAN